jgi:hypothetical protein
MTLRRLAASLIDLVSAGELDAAISPNLKELGCGE